MRCGKASFYAGLASGAFAKPHALSQQLFGTLVELDQYRCKLDLINLDWAATLAPAQRGLTLRYGNMAGQSMEKDVALWGVLKIQHCDAGPSFILSTQ
ncbi:hypothetical protein [Alcaligenes aquatilis]|uniref:hypothetical protein n=1 Tax=Alcaligenes aquatilis TaxID=323284 RepID=UPI0013CE73D7|nr:hypothetical protein [Alcaligenes aquatilis]